MTGAAALPAARAALGGAASSRRFGMSVPTSASLIGGQLFAQGLVVEPTANALGAALSNAVAAAFGGR